MTNQPPPPPDIFSITFKTPPPKVRLGGLFHTLFFHPLDLVFYLSGQTLGRSLFRVLSIAILCAIVLSAARAPMIRRELAAWLPWLQTEMTDVAFQNGELSWTPVQKLPYSRHFRGWRVTFSDKPAADFDPLKHYGPESKGVWIGPQALITWQRVEGRDALARHQFNLRPLAKWIIAGQQGKDQSARVPILLDQRNHFFSVNYWVIFWGASTIFTIFGDVLFYSFLFAAIPLILRGARKKGAFSQAISFYLNLSIVPLLVATVYALFRIPVLDFSSVFSFAFMLYILFILFGTRWRFRKARLTEEDR